MMIAAVAPTVLGLLTSKDNTIRSLLYMSGGIESGTSIVTVVPVSFALK